jgi:RNA polymerase sigma factor (sigma-70 family)
MARVIMGCEKSYKIVSIGVRYMPPGSDHPSAVSDLRDPAGLASLYERLAPRVAALVARNVTAPPGVVEEACQVAWSRLVMHRDRVAPESTLGWLTTTATREALRTLRIHRRQLSLDELDGAARVIDLPVRAPGPDRMVELREQLAEVHQLPVRQRQMVWLQGLGYEYEEIARVTGDSRRTVERQLLRAKQRLRLLT